MVSPSSPSPRILFQVFVLLVTAAVGAAVGWFLGVRSAARPGELIELEHAFRDRCKSVGVVDAFLEFSARDAVYFDVDPQELRGPQALATRRTGWAGIKQLEWEPVESHVACSGELGYTWGTSEMHLATEEGKEPKIIYGHYVCIWKRDADGRWRIALDTGNARPDGRKPAPAKKS